MIYTKKTPGLFGSGTICNAPVPVIAEVREGRNPPMSRKASLLRVSDKLAIYVRDII